MPGNRAGDPVVVAIYIRQIKYTTNGDLFYTLDYSENWQTLPHRRRRKNQRINVYNVNLFNRQPPISDDKFAHLQEMKAVIEKEHHPF